jgi:tetratricopeptide (TPR) repeat protein
MNSQYLPAYITLAFSCQALGKNEAALQAAEQAVELSPKTPQVHVAKANVLLALGRDQEALAELDTASHCDPNNAEIQMEMGDVCWRNLKSPKQALEHYLTATNINPALAPVYVRLGDYYLYSHDTNSAGPVLRMLRHLSPDGPEVLTLEDRWQRLVASGSTPGRH